MIEEKNELGSQLEIDASLAFSSLLFYDYLCLKKERKEEKKKCKGELALMLVTTTY